MTTTDSFRSYPSLSSLVALDCDAPRYLRPSRKSPTGYVVCFTFGPLEYHPALAVAQRFGGAVRTWYFSDGSSVMHVHGILVSVPVSGVAGVPPKAVRSIAGNVPCII